MAFLMLGIVGCDFAEYSSSTPSDFDSLFDSNVSEDVSSDNEKNNDTKPSEEGTEEDKVNDKTESVTDKDEDTSSGDNASSNDEIQSSGTESDSTDTESDTEDKETVEDNKIISPIRNNFSGACEEAVSKFDDAGFTNVKVEASYELSTGFFASLSLGDVKSISIDGNANFSVGDEFDKNSQVVITYKEYEYKNPNIEFTAVTVDKMLKDVESNELTAEEKYNGKYVAVKGRVDDIDDSGNFSLYPVNNKWAIMNVSCFLLDDEQKEGVRNIKKGQVITVKGKITLVSDWLGYSLDVYSFD